MSKAIDKAAAAHYALGALDKFLKGLPVPVGHHDLCNIEMTLTFPNVAFVDRAEGTKGEGFNLAKPVIVAPLEFTFEAMKLYVERLSEVELKSPAKNQKLLAECLRDSLKGTKAEFSADALKALAIVQAEQPVLEPPALGEPTKTSSKRTGDLEVDIECRRPVKAKVA